MYYYKSNYIPSSGKTYKIVATHSNFNKIEASTYIPNNLEIYNFETDTNSNEIVQFNFSFIDDISSRNYYGIELYASCSKTWGYEEYQFSGNPTIHSNDPSFPGVFLSLDILLSENQSCLLTHYLMDKKKIFL